MHSESEHFRDQEDPARPILTPKHVWRGPHIDLLGLAGVIGLIAAHGFFVAAEFGLVAVDRARIEQEAEDGHPRARSTLAALKSLSFQLSGAQLGITATSLLVGFLIEPAVAPFLEPLVALVGLPEGTSLAVSITLALILATAIEMVVAELIPKNIAIARPLGMAYATGPPLRLINRLLRPLILFLNSSANFTVRLIRIEPKDELMPVRSLKELELLIRSSREGGALLEEEYALLSRSISFASKTAAEALVPRTSIVALHKNETLADLAAKALESGHSRFPVHGGDLDDILGIAHVKDSYRFPVDERPRTPVERIIQSPVVAPESRDLESLLLEMRREQRHMAVIVDEYGGTAGIVTIEDLLEEIVGEIEDEHDLADSPQVTSGVPAGVHLLSGGLHLDEVEDVCGLQIPSGPYETLAGFLLSLFDRIPATGDHVSHEGWEFKVVEMQRNRIDKILIVRSDEGQTDDSE